MGDVTTPPEFFEWLKKELDKRGWSEADLARKSGMPQSIISGARRGTQAMGIISTNKIADALGVPQVTVAIMAGLIEPPGKRFNVNELNDQAKEIQAMLDDMSDQELKALERIGERARKLREQRARYDV